MKKLAPINLRCLYYKTTLIGGILCFLGFHDYRKCLLSIGWKAVCQRCWKQKDLKQSIKKLKKELEVAESYGIKFGDINN